MNATFTNPVLDFDFADPSVIKAKDGMYYAYGTRSYDPAKKTLIQVAHSENFTDWEVLGNAFAEKPRWAQRTIEFWAPHVAEVGSKYLMYFSTQPDATEGMGIGVATADSPAGPFIVLQEPLLTGPTFTTIDPMIFLDPVSQQKFLLWGSGHGPIWIQQLAEDGLAFAADTQPLALLHTSSAPYENLIEGSYLIFHDGWYFLFYSGDNVWEKGRYAVMIARSKNILGPYEKKQSDDGQIDNVILQGNDTWDAPGQNSLIQDAAGDWWTFYHAVNLNTRLYPNTQDLRRVMLLDRVIFEDGWPRIADGTPTTHAQTAPQL